MKFNYDTFYGTFIKRPNRFIAHIDINGQEVICHVPNTGRMRELLIPGVPVMLSRHDTTTRKTEYELRMIMKNFKWISIDSQLPNALAHEAIAFNLISELQGYREIKREVTYNNSRLDFKLIGEDTCFIEVKGVTLEKDGWCYFPDAPTERGRKHMDELIRAKAEGYRSVLLFIIQIEDARGFSPNWTTDKAFADKLKAAQDKGVEILAYNCHVSPDEVYVAGRVPIII